MKSNITIGDITDFFLEETKLGWSYDETVKFINWYNDLDLMRIITNVDGDILCLILARRVATLKQASEYYSQSNEGPLLWIDFMACKDTSAWSYLADFLDEISDIRAIAFNRSLRNDPEERLYKIEKFKNRLKGYKK